MTAPNVSTFYKSALIVMIGKPLNMLYLQVFIEISLFVIIKLFDCPGLDPVQVGVIA